MSKLTKTFLLWTPRVLSIVYLLFLGLSSLDIFGTGASVWETLVAFMIHNLPALSLLVFLILGWCWEWVGAVGFLLFGIVYIVINHWDLPEFLLIIGGVPILIGIFFVIGWGLHTKIRER